MQASTRHFRRCRFILTEQFGELFRHCATKFLGIHNGDGPHVSAFLSSYFSLVGTHGLHVTSGLIWLAVIMIQIKKFGLTTATTRRLACLSLFWHFLDIVWICVFSVVYLLGVL